MACTAPAEVSTSQYRVRSIARSSCGESLRIAVDRIPEWSRIFNHPTSGWSGRHVGGTARARVASTRPATSSRRLATPLA